ncbi:MAG: hypothetical protein AB1629_08070 [Candidatus Omnitrophota bacterium]
MDMDNCFFCKNSISKERIPQRDAYEITCPACGYYQITGTAALCGIPQGVDEKDLILFSSYLRNNSSLENPIIIQGNDLKEIKSRVAPYEKLTPIDKINLFIKYLGDSLKFLGDRIQINDNDYTRFYCLNSDEMVHIQNYLIQRGWASEEPYPLCSLSVDGWQVYESLKQINIESKKVFVAMSFAPELKYIFDEAIFPACDECGFKAFRVDSKDHIEKICDKIIADIKESRFIIADFSGQKHGVYFEAGFAQGLGLKVIWTCKKGEEDKLHFDTRQYNHIIWENPEDFKKQLISKIKANIK